MNVALPVDPGEPLARHRDRAEATLNAAREVNYQTQMIDVARIVTAAPPTAASIDLARDLYDFPNGLCLLAVHAADGTPLWGDELETGSRRDRRDRRPGRERRYPRGCRRQAAGLVASAHCGAGREVSRRPARPRHGRKPHQHAPDDHAPRVEAVADRDPDSATELHVFLDGMPVTAELTEVDRDGAGGSVTGASLPPSTRPPPAQQQRN
ncbi:hypothetical protein [Saccharopolyspora sp. ASAGF58]|uniref:hypothetical protein n=1 Tax=Saccharopolyspora sp. ASAGF58 TaxID=2719023 RepID=UPI0014401AA2|nr:hypothetical protein [Saccharopolyspora sp. ASAGF58]QIZ37830.1 hypothetical protein FDZ84_28710 [Saccharopolyspora sp. ASAGF58]